MEQQPVVTPALEGSRRIEPINGKVPRLPLRSLTPNFERYPRPLMPLTSRMMMPQRPRYLGPPSLMPLWGGYSVGNRYFPGNNVVQIPVYIKRPPPQRVAPVVVPQKRIVVPKKPKVNNRPSSVFLFGIILKEIVAALHKIYLNPNGNIYPVLCDIIGPNCYDLAALIHGPIKDQQEYNVLKQDMEYALENLCYHITEIMPNTGVLGTHKRSAVFELVRNGKRFPEGYFWQVEMERLQFNEHGRTVNVGEYEAFLLLVGIFVSRSLITTLLMKPRDYGLSSTELSDVAERNLRVIASAFMFLIRRITRTRTDRMMPNPQEIARYLYDDNEMQRINSELSATYNYCEGLLREWGTEYLRRLRACVYR